MNYGFTYAGIVESNKDPLKLGRLKVRVPHVFGSDSTGSGYIPVNDLPWALPAGMPAGGTADSGGFSQLPETGDSVWVRFLDGEPEKPIWEWGMQTIYGRDELLLHRYAIGTPVGAPDRTVWTRYSHAIEINEGSIILTTSQGYRLVATDSSVPLAGDGNLVLTTQHGNMIQLDDLDDTIKLICLGDMYIEVEDGVLGMTDSFSWMTMTKDFSVNSGRKFRVTATNNLEMTTATDILIDALGSTRFTTTSDFVMGFATLRLGLAATEAAVLGNLMVTYLTSLQLWLDTHTHVSASSGSPTSPPVVPSVGAVQPLAATLISTTVRVQN